MLPALAVSAQSGGAGNPADTEPDTEPLPSSLRTQTGKSNRFRFQERPQDDPVELAATVWTLEKALARAMEANPDVLRARNALLQQEGALMQVRARLFPNLDLSADLSQRDQDLLDRSPTRGPFVPSEQTSIADTRYGVRLQFSFLVWDGKAQKRHVEVQKLLGKRLYFQAQSTAFRVATIVDQAFDHLLYRQNVLRITNETVEALETLAEQTSRRHELGEIPELDTLRVRTELMGARAESATAVSELMRGQQLLRRTLNLPDSVAAGSSLKIDGALQQRVFGIAIEEAERRALSLRSDLLAAKAQVEAAEVGVSATRSQYFPRIGGFVDYRLNTSYYDSDTRLDGWMVGISGTWKIFEAGARRGRIIAKQAELSTSRLASRNLENDITWRLQELYSVLHQSRTVISAQTTAVSFGEQSVEQAQRMYEIGEVSINDVLDAELSLRLSQIRLQAAIYNNNSAIGQVRYVIGGPDVESPFGEWEE